MKHNDLFLSPLPGLDEPKLNSDEFQTSLRGFDHALRARGFQVSPRVIIRKSVGSESSYLGDFIIPLAKAYGPSLGAVLIAWVHGRSGRKVRVKMGDVEVEAGTTKEVQGLLTKIKALQEKSRDAAESDL